MCELFDTTKEFFSIWYSICFFFTIFVAFTKEFFIDCQSIHFITIFLKGLGWGTPTRYWKTWGIFFSILAKIRKIMSPHMHVFLPTLTKLNFCSLSLEERIQKLLLKATQKYSQKTPAEVGVPGTPWRVFMWVLIIRERTLWMQPAHPPHPFSGPSVKHTLPLTGSVPLFKSIEETQARMMHNVNKSSGEPHSWWL